MPLTFCQSKPLFHKIAWLQHVRHGRGHKNGSSRVIDRYFCLGIHWGYWYHRNMCCGLRSLCCSLKRMGSSFHEFWDSLVTDPQILSGYDVITVYIVDKVSSAFLKLAVRANWLTFLSFGVLFCVIQFSIWDMPTTHSTNFASQSNECPYATLQVSYHRHAEI